MEFYFVREIDFVFDFTSGFLTFSDLICRCKSYDLGALIEKLLFKPQENRFEVDVDTMKKAYGSSKSLMQVTSACLQDAEDTLRCICDLNALPLALQITQVAGNVMSRTLLGIFSASCRKCSLFMYLFVMKLVYINIFLGGRAERNEFLLLHAFNEKNYIVPDKQYGGKKVKPQDDGMDDMEADTTTTKVSKYFKHGNIFIFFEFFLVKLKILIYLFIL